MSTLRDQVAAAETIEVGGVEVTRLDVCEYEAGWRVLAAVLAIVRGEDA